MRKPRGSQGHEEARLPSLVELDWENSTSDKKMNGINEEHKILWKLGKDVHQRVIGQLGSSRGCPSERGFPSAVK